MTIVKLSNGDSGHYASARTGITSTDVLIVGTGPAGASLACFLASYGEWDLILCWILLSVRFTDELRDPGYNDQCGTYKCRHTTGTHYQHGCNG